jgi:hypothetical protein
MNEEGPSEKSKRQQVGLYKRPQDYDPLLLLQSIPEIRLHATRFYQDGLEKFLRKGKHIHEPYAMTEYKLSCVCQAQEYVKCLLKANYPNQKRVEAHQVPQGEENEFGPQLVPQRWDRVAKWDPVWTQMRAERKQIASELGNGLLNEQVCLC